MKSERGYTIVEVLVVAVLLFGAAGWIWNIVKIAHTCCEISGMLVLRVAGIFVPPLGAVIGYF